MGNVDWFKNAVIYHILIDRFSGFKLIENWDKPNFLGGTINGITEKLSYIHGLGINTIWISPFYKTSEYHGYHITDFYDVDQHFGTKKDIERLVETVHKHDMRIITDFVPNHCSNQHPYFLEAQQNKKSDYRRWFYFFKWPNNYLCFLNYKQLPKINLSYPNARDYIINAAKHWLSLGFDGYRLDHVIGPSHHFWQRFKAEIKSVFPNVILIGEAWMKGIKFNDLKTINVKYKLLKWIFGSSSDYLLKEYIGELDGVLDFRLQELIRDYIATGRITEKEFYHQIKSHYRKYPDSYFLPTFLDNHDMNRFLFECKNNKEKLKQAAEILFSIAQPTIIYYGTEIGMTQKKSIWEYQTCGDLQTRQPMDWIQQDEKLLTFYKKIIKQKI